MKKIYALRSTCRGCSGKNLRELINMGPMPLAGAFLRKQDAQKEQKIPLVLYLCEDCKLVQILHVVDSNVLFKNYMYKSSVIPELSHHFREFASFLSKNYLKPTKDKLLEFGSNDGVLLQHLTRLGHTNILGIDPSLNINKIARGKKLHIVTGYFAQKTASQLLKKEGHMDVITGSNVFAHIDDIQEILKAATILLSSSGVFIVEVHYVLNIFRKFQYDFIYHEHLSYYSATSLSHIFNLAGFKIVDVQNLQIHGGSIRVVAAPLTSKLIPSRNVRKILTHEKKLGVSKLTFYQDFAEKCHLHKAKLMTLLRALKKDNKTIIGYGASGRATTLLNFCGITQKYIDYIVDISSLRIGKLMPGVHIPIYNVTVARRSQPDYFLVLAWSYFASILKQEKKLAEKGVKFIVPLPNITII